MIDSCWKGATKYSDKSWSKEIAQLPWASSNAGSLVCAGWLAVNVRACHLWKRSAYCKTRRKASHCPSFLGRRAATQVAQHPEGHGCTFGQLGHHGAGTEGRWQSPYLYKLHISSPAAALCASGLEVAGILGGRVVPYFQFLIICWLFPPYQRHGWWQGCPARWLPLAAHTRPAPHWSGAALLCSSCPAPYLQPTFQNLLLASTAAFMWGKPYGGPTHRPPGTLREQGTRLTPRTVFFLGSLCFTQHSLPFPLKPVFQLRSNP